MMTISLMVASMIVSWDLLHIHLPDEESRKSTRFCAIILPIPSSQSDMEAAVREVAKGKKDLEAVLLDHYRISKTDLGKALGEYFDCPYIPYDDRTVIDPELLKDLNQDYLRKYHWIPLKRRDGLLDILIDNPQDTEKGSEILGCREQDLD